MSSSYAVQLNDTFESISRKVYGTELKAELISHANPSVFEPIPSLISVIIPDDPDEPENSLQAAVSDSENEVSVLINGKRFRFWTSVLINHQLDSFSTIELSAPFDPENKEFRKTFIPFSFAPIEVNIGGEPSFTGQIVTPIPEISKDGNTVLVTAYSKPGVLNDCSAPPDMAPLEFKKIGLEPIATKLANAFGIGVVFDDSQGAVFGRVSMNSGERVYSFLTRLAAQTNLVISNTARGKLLFWRSVEAGNPVASLKIGESPLLSVTPSLNAQQYYSSVTGVEPMLFGSGGKPFTVHNPKLNNVVRPFTYEISDTSGGSIEKAVKTKAARMFANIASYNIAVSTWRDPEGELWKPNTTIKLVAPGAMIYKEYEFTIRSVQFSRSSEKETATLNLIMPGSLAGIMPESLPWEM